MSKLAVSAGSRMIHQDGAFVAEAIGSEVAALIVKRVNMHEELVEALREAYACIEHLHKGQVPPPKDSVNSTVVFLQNAIAKAEAK